MLFENLMRNTRGQPSNEATSVPVNTVDEVVSFDNLSALLSPDRYTSAQKALHNSDLFSVINLLASDLASSRWTAASKRAQTILDTPASTTNRSSFWRAMFAQELLDGNAYAYIWRNVNGQPMRLEYLRPDQVSVYLLADGSGLIYSATFDEPDVGVLQTIPQSDMIHLRLMDARSGGKIGASPLMALQDTFKVSDQANTLTLSALTHAMANSGVLSMAKEGGLLDVKDKIAMSKSFYQQSVASKGPVVLDALTEYTPLNVNTDVSSLLSSTSWTGTQIAKVYGVPDSYLNGQGDQQSSLAMIQELYANTVHRYADINAAEIGDKLRSKVTVNVLPAIDQDYSTFVTNVATGTRYGAIQGPQADALLRQVGFFDDTIPKYQKPTTPVSQPINNNSAKGGDNDDKEDID